MKKFVSLKARALVAMSLAVIVIIAGTVTIGYVLSSLSYSQKIKSPFNMSYKAPEEPAYPQTYVGDSLNETLENLISSSSSELIATGKKYTTDANGTTKECLEYTYNGQKYARLVGAVPYNSSTKFLNSSGGGTITSGNNYWFKIEPIEFDTFTLSTGETVKMARMILGSQTFYANDYDRPPDDYWPTSLITYLNSTFLTETGLYKIAKDRTYYSTGYMSGADYNPEFSSNGDSLTSKIWLPSVGEIQEIYTTDAERHKVATDFARATYIWVTTDTSASYMKDINGTSESCSAFWLRSVYSSDDYFYWYVGSSGGISYGFRSDSDVGFSLAFVVNE